MSISQDQPVVNSLVLYKIHPARVLSVADKIEIELEDGKTKRVRSKDVELLHPGPIETLAELKPCGGEIEEAWELLAGSSTHLRELAELIYDNYSPATTWAAWQVVAEGLYFQGTPQSIEVRSAEAVAAEQAQRQAKVEAVRAQQEFIARMAAGCFDEADRGRLTEVEMLALGRREGSRVLGALGHQESRENAHRLLVKIGYWEPYFNPYPRRQPVPTDPPRGELPELPDEQRRDLTSLAAFAIDDAGNQDPDDAISLQDGRLWVHIADVAALILPDSEADLEARARGANLYLPETIIPMLPPDATRRLGLGLAEISPALSVGFGLDNAGVIADVEVVLSWIRARRLTYAEADARIEESPLREIRELTERFRERRAAAGASAIDLPEVTVRVQDGQVAVRPLPRLRSRDMVTDAMVMAGEAVARFARERELPIPFAVQAPPDSVARPEGMAAMYSYRRQLKPSRLSIQPDWHSGLGLELYTRVTSPLRRYSDLLVHQQLRALLGVRDPLEGGEVANRAAQADTAGMAVRRVERLSNLHWKLVYLQQNPGWKGEGVLVELDANRSSFLLPELAMETKVRLRNGAGLDDRRLLAVRQVDLPDLSARFRILR